MTCQTRIFQASQNCHIFGVIILHLLILDIYCLFLAQLHNWVIACQINQISETLSAQIFDFVNI